MNAQDIIIQPIITEKSTKDVQSGKFTFRVMRESDKTAIKKAVENIFNVTVISVGTQIIKSRKKRVGKLRVEVSEQPWKKATVQLAKDQKIDLFDVGEKA